MSQCPKCGTKSRKRRDYCSKCHTSLTGVEAPPSQSATPSGALPDAIGDDEVSYDVPPIDAEDFKAGEAPPPPGMSEPPIPSTPPPMPAAPPAIPTAPGVTAAQSKEMEDAESMGEDLGDSIADIVESWTGEGTVNHGKMKSAFRRIMRRHPETAKAKYADYIDYVVIGSCLIPPIMKKMESQKRR